MVEEDYSTDELKKLQAEVAELRKDPVNNTKASITLIESMDRLAVQISSLISIFESANKEMAREYQKGYHDELNKLNKIITQNEKIARGILAVADTIKNHQPEVPQQTYPLEPTPQPSAPTPEFGSPRLDRKSLRREFR